MKSLRRKLLAARITAELKEEAEARGEAAPRPGEVLALVELLQEGLAPASRYPPRLRPGLLTLGRLMAAEARLLPAAFWGLELGLAGLALLAAPVLQSLPSPLDAWAMVAPWLGTAAVLAGLWPAGGPWQELQRLSPIPAGWRLLGKVVVALGLSVLLQTAGGLAALPGQPGPLPPARILGLALMRDAPLILAGGWTLLVSRHFGSWGSLGASLALWILLEAVLPGVGRLALFTLHPGPAAPLAAACMGAAGFALIAAGVRTAEEPERL